MQKITIFIFTVLMLSITSLAFAAEHGHHQKPSTEDGIQVSPDLKKLLNQEMAAIQNGMMALIPAMSAGEWDEAATIGKNIKASFIMKQKLTKAQKEELHRVLPPSFIEMDQAFHKSAGMLAHAAEMKNADVANFYFFKLNEACVSCHAKFATGRFPGLVKSADEDGHH
ncbi:MAG: hypothetical protein KAU27_00165 [Desulfuromonadales bacterium]|nr:hypothetical protein [Desulfuromonadales bacterium]